VKQNYLVEWILSGVDGSGVILPSVNSPVSRIGWLCFARKLGFPPFAATRKLFSFNYLDRLRRGSSFVFIWKDYEMGS